MTDETAIVDEPTAYPSPPDLGTAVPPAAPLESADAELAGDQSSFDETDSSLEQDSSNDESPSGDREELPLLGDTPVAFTEGTSATIEGHLEEIVFRNEREGFTVGNFRLSDGRALTVVGPLASAVLEAPVIISGAFARDPRFGLQFHITETLDPLVSEEVAQAYLASGLIPYIGAAGAAEIVAAAGSQTLRMLATGPDSLLDYRGITPRRLPAIKRALRETLALAPVVGLLGLAIERAQATGREARKLSLRAAKRIHRRYGASAAEIIRANPWRMAKEIAGVGFRSADNVAIGLGCPLDSPTRLEAAVLEALRTAAVEEGHIVYPGTVLEADAVKLAIRPNAEARAAIERLVKSGEILHIERPEGYALPRLAEAEKLIAAKLRVIVAFADANPIVVNEEDIDEVERDENEALSAFSRLSDTGPTAVSLPNPHLPQASEDELRQGLRSASPEAAKSASGASSGLVTSANAVAPANAVSPGSVVVPANVMAPAHRELPMMASLDTPAGVFHFDVSQRRAIRKALEDRVTIITGQPGTGKTTLVRAILDLADDHGLSSALVSPTGRAAKRLSEATGRPAQTIHRFLRYHPDEGFRGPETLPDVLVVDEVSMLDSPLAAHLFGALPPFVRLILVGDEDQLPAVGPGNVLGDLLGAPAVNVLRLSTIHRTASGSGIPALARQIRIGVRKPVYDRVTTRFIARGDDPTQKPAEQAAAIAGWIAETIERYKDRIDEFQILCPMRKTACGTEALNRIVQDIVNPGPHPRSIRREGFNLCPGDRILVTENDYENGLFNGDVGRLLDITEDGRLVTSFDGIERVLPPDAGGGFILAYAMSIHRAQGSEFPIVIIPMTTSFFKMLERRLLYTAVSRARQTVAIVGQQKAVSIAIGTHDTRARRTLLLEYLTASVGPQMTVLAPSDVPEDELF